MSTDRPLVRITPTALLDALHGADELALIDVRPGGRAGQAHLLAARPVPLDRLDLDMPDLVPRRGTGIVLVDDGGAQASLAASRLACLGYEQVSALDGGVPAWQAAGGSVFAGIRSMSKAFGEFIHEAARTPTITAAGLRDLGHAVLLADVRPPDEFVERTLPGAMNISGGELLRLGAMMAQDPTRPIVLTCASETRGLLAAQSLIDAGVPNPVFALEGGVMAWHLAGFVPQAGVAPPGSGAAGVAPLRLPGEPRRISVDTLRAWSGDPGRTTYLFDLRCQAQYAAGHIEGARPVQAVQLVQALDRYVGTWRARIVLVDDACGAEAGWAGWWLAQMGWREVAWLPHQANGEVQLRAGAWQSQAIHPCLPTDRAWKAGTPVPPDMTVLDLATSLEYRRGHIPGAVWTTRTNLSSVLRALDPDRRILVTSPDGRLAVHATAEQDGHVMVLAGGTVAWAQRGGVLEQGGIADAACTDVILRPFDRLEGREAAMQRTLDWRVGTLDKAGLPVQFRRFGISEGFELP